MRFFFCKWKGGCVYWFLYVVLFFFVGWFGLFLVVRGGGGGGEWGVVEVGGVVMEFGGCFVGCWELWFGLCGLLGVVVWGFVCWSVWWIISFIRLCGCVCGFCSLVVFCLCGCCLWEGFNFVFFYKFSFMKFLEKN